MAILSLSRDMCLMCQWFLLVFLPPTGTMQISLGIFFSLLPELNSHQLIIGGDLNCVLDPTLDHSSITSGTLSKSAETINSFLQTYGVIDSWRYRNPISRWYSFFSSPAHHSYSRKDYFLLAKKLLPHCYFLLLMLPGPGHLRSHVLDMSKVGTVLVLNF